jgi:hypothetical protein
LLVRTFFNNAVKIGGNYFSTYVIINDVTDGFIVRHYFILPGNAFFSHQGWVGGYAIQYAQIVGFFYFVKIGCVDKEFHGKSGLRLAKLKKTKKFPDICKEGLKKWQTEHRTATTAYPCYLPAWGSSAGAGRADLPGAKVIK